MDLNEIVWGGSIEWTEERHSSFLNWLEECFVRQMIRHSTTSDEQLPLDRYLPDSGTESTRDLRYVPAAANNKRPPSSDKDDNEGGIATRDKTRKLLGANSYSACKDNHPVQIGTMKDEDVNSSNNEDIVVLQTSQPAGIGRRKRRHYQPLATV